MWLHCPPPSNCQHLRLCYQAGNVYHINHYCYLLLIFLTANVQEIHCNPFPSKNDLTTAENITHTQPQKCSFRPISLCLSVVNRAFRMPPGLKIPALSSSSSITWCKYQMQFRGVRIDGLGTYDGLESRKKPGTKRIQMKGSVEQTVKCNYPLFRPNMIFRFYAL